MDQLPGTSPIQTPPSAPSAKSSRRILLILSFLFLIIGAIGGFLIGKNFEPPRKQETITGMKPTTTIIPTPITSQVNNCPILNNFSADSDNGIAMLLSEDCGKVGADVTITRKGIPASETMPGCSFAFYDNNNNYTVLKTTQTEIGKDEAEYSFNVPETVLGKAFPTEGYHSKEIPTAIGPAAILFYCEGIVEKNASMKLLYTVLP